MTERRKTTHEGITPPSFRYSHGMQGPKGARGAGQVFRIQENKSGFCYSHAVQAPKPAEFCYSHAVQALKPTGFCYSHGVQALKPAGFCYSHGVQAPKPAEFCYPHAVQALKGARGAGQVCRRHRITHPSMLPARSVSTENQATPLTAARRTREFSCGAGTRTWLGCGRRGL